MDSLLLASARVRSARLAARRIDQVTTRLRFARASVLFAAAALQGQNADVDADVARWLLRSVADPLGAQIDSLQRVRRLLIKGEGRTGRRRAHSHGHRRPKRPT